MQAHILSIKEEKVRESIKINSRVGNLFMRSRTKIDMHPGHNFHFPLAHVHNML